MDFEFVGYSDDGLAIFEIASDEPAFAIPEPPREIIELIEAA